MNFSTNWIHFEFQIILEIINRVYQVFIYFGIYLSNIFFKEIKRKF